MQKKSTSEGECLYCKKKVGKTSMTKHLVTELKSKETSGKAKLGKSFLVKVEPNKKYYGANGFFLYLWMDGNDTMSDIDYFLRNIWLECCGHMSAFRNPKKKRGGGMWDMFEAMELMENGEMEEEAGEISNRKLKDALYKNLVLGYEYDFGSSTYLTLTVAEEFSVAAVAKEMLLSRNEPLEILCSECGKEPAVKICIADGGGFCPKCAKKHAKECEDFAEYAAMPVVNSPRMGVCAYTGGTIDKKRDGVFVVENKPIS
jgi:hypothetical protein